MILLDGVRYVLQAPAKEEVLEDMVREHCRDIWGPNAHYFAKSKLQSPSGVTAIPDGYVITFDDVPQWYVVEVELSSHNLYDHILPQVSKFAAGIANIASQHQIAAAIYRTIDSDELLKAWVRTRIASGEIHKFLTDAIGKPPVLAVLFEKEHPQWSEVRDQLGQRFKSVLDRVFKTFVREGCQSDVHAHIFEPLWEATRPRPEPAPPRPRTPLPPSPRNVLEVELTSPSCTKFHLFKIRRGQRDFFPGYKVPFRLETDMGTIETHVTSAPDGTAVGDPAAGRYIQANLSKWYKAHPELQVGSRLLIEAVEPMKLYRLKVAQA